MPWHAWVGFYIISGSIVGKILIKRFAASPARLFWLIGQYALCVLFSIAYLAASRTRLDPHLFILFTGLGIASSVSTYAQWRAIDMSMSVTSLSTPFGGLIALALGFIFLHEARYLNAGVVAGLFCSFIAVILFIRSHFTGGQIPMRKLARFIALMSGMAGVVIFLMRLFAHQGVPLPLYVTGWYTGTLFGALILYFWKGRGAAPADFSLCNAGLLVLLALSIWTAKTFLYLAFARAPITVIEPVFQVSEIIFPSLLGLYWYKEIRSLSRIQKYSFALGAAGSILIALNY